jgi:hypothetical protein
MANDIQGMRIAVLVSNEGIEHVGLTERWRLLERAGAHRCRR